MDKDQQTIRFILHTDPIVPGDGPNKLMHNWAVIQLDKKKFNWETFLGKLGFKFICFPLGFPYILELWLITLSQVAISYHNDASNDV